MVIKRIIALSEIYLMHSHVLVLLIVRDLWEGKAYKSTVNIRLWNQYIIR